MKYLIIGGVAGGVTTAARLRRLDEKSEIIVFERGEYISYALTSSLKKLQAYNDKGLSEKLFGKQDVLKLVEQFLHIG